MHIYGSRISYYTGKLETYLRYRSIDYKLLPTVGNYRKLKANAGVVQMPVVELDDGRWMSDTTPMIAWFEGEQSAPSIYPSDPALRFIALLIEDYADEWLWRPAMHFRWSYPESRRYASDVLYRELLRGVRPMPGFVARRVLIRRQLGGFVQGDGISDDTKDHADRSYFRALDCLQAIFEHRPFLLGDRPTIADFGMMGPMFRHFGQDPDPAEIMRRRGPAVYEWVARMWNLKADDRAPSLVDITDANLTPFLREVCETHLTQLKQNAVAYGGGKTRYNLSVQGCLYQQVPVSRYRVWCLEELRREWAALDGAAQAKLRETLTAPEASLLWDETTYAPSTYNADGKAPFNKAINVFGDGVPPK